MSIVHEDQNIVIQIERSSLRKLKGKLLQELPPDQVRHRSQDTLLVPFAAAPLVARILPEFGVQIPAWLQYASDSRNESASAQSSARDEVRKILEEGRSATGDAEWDAILDPSQGVAVNAITLNQLKGMCLFDEQGTGKTVMTIAGFDLLRKRGVVDKLIVIAPKSMVKEWPREFARFTGQRHNVAALDGDRNDRFEQVQRPADVYVLNFEAVEPLLAILSAVASSARTMLAVDESFFVKNPDAMRSAAVRELRRACTRGIVLCGTPAPNQPMDIVHQFDIADDGITFEGAEIPQEPEQAKSRIMHIIEDRGIYIRRLKEDVLPDLPEKQFIVHPVDMVGKQQLLYQKTKNELALFLKSLDNQTFKRSIGTYFQKRAALLQLCVSPRLVDPSYLEVSAKYAYLDGLLERLVKSEDRKVVLWSFFKGSLDDLQERYGHYGLVRVDGSVHSDDRADAIRRFQNDNAVKVFVGNPAAAGAGITLHAAADAIYLSYSNQAAHYFQSLDRIHRRGQESSYTTFHLITCRGTIEEAEIQRLRHKERQQQELLGDAVAWPSSLDEALAELMA